MMKSIFTACLALLITATTFGQKISKIKELTQAGNWAEAKTLIEQFLANEKNAAKGEGWFYKAQIFNGVAKEATDAGKIAEAEGPRKQAFEAYQKYLDLDKKAVEGTLTQHATLFEIAFGFQDMAIAAYNAKEFGEAAKQFQNLENVETYIIGKEYQYGTFSFPVFDTNLYLNIAASALNSQNNDLAAKYYSKIVDQKVTGEGYEEIYRFVVDYWDRKGDESNANKYLAIGKEVYPTDEYWCEVGLDAAKDEPKKLFATYEKLIKNGCDNYFTHYNYGVELYNYANAGDDKPADREESRAKLESLLKTALSKDPNGTEAHMLMVRHYMAYVADLNDEYEAVKGKTDADKKKKDEINKQIEQKFDLAFPYMDNLYKLFSAKTDLKSGEKGQFKLLISLLSDYYSIKDNDEKYKEFQQLMKKDL